MRTMLGIVTSAKREKTATVEVSRMWQHPIYQKLVKRSKKYACHYENLEIKEGDTVEIQESKPMSKTKRFVINKKVGK
ncbi:MAG: 30S ribosomal protein S17 [Candidatus Pacebacteria bacterium CG10_big_fil_rev_8_21_14_0_10_36_11]|nr:30S ribosomal protein S17 [Candidatus Pacearchaeota archaeon]OIP73694.1 MAG: 30S ribosomal protein S17 [Candidatus Pacebacteria bacterium CG2_30_36_39]PIR64721.1 MAG: 30S ribosomal protein S17 [Candidatus Pacebacteria bacterium CG10_big_fil_rev_8_21_14_0_10_36_11]PJC42344.1 MAG: 30S ribosomal protein S17 [Candidatus Pacebacteria bacterium CG_4_9_14_0_2_um_filter_36_8]